MSDGPRFTRRAILWIGLLATGVMCWLAVRSADFGEVGTAAAGADVGVLVAALAVYACSIVLRAARWRVLFPAGDRPSIVALTQCVFVGYLFDTILPARAGDAARVVAINQRAGASLGVAAGTVMVERALDLLGLLVLFFAISPFMPTVSWVSGAAILASVIVVALGILIAVLTRYGVRPLMTVLRPATRLPAISPERLERAVSAVGLGLDGIRRPLVVTQALALTLASWTVMAASFWLVSLAFDFDLPPAAGLLVLVAVGVSMIIPSSPAAVGVFEAAVIVALSAYDVPHSPALSYALVLHGLVILLYLVCGAVALGALADRARRRARAAASNRSVDLDSVGNERSPTIAPPDRDRVDAAK